MPGNGGRSLLGKPALFLTETKTYPLRAEDSLRLLEAIPTLRLASYQPTMYKRSHTTPQAGSGELFR